VREEIFKEYRLPMLHGAMALVVFYLLLVAVDWLIDPGAAPNALVARFFSLLAFLAPVAALALRASLGICFAASCIGLIINAGLFMVALHALNGGLLQGAAEHFYLFLGSLLLGLGFPFSYNAWICALLPLSQHLAAFFIAPDFDHLRHAMLFWPMAAASAWLHWGRRKLQVQKNYLNWEMNVHVMTDSLTGLLNRRSLEQSFQYVRSQAMRHGQDQYLLLVDIDHFQQIVGGYGHAFGDQVLRKLASILRDSFRGGDLSARLGDNRFACVLQEVDQEIAWGIAERLRQKISGTPVEGAATPHGILKFTVSIGIATSAPQDDLKVLLNRGEVALYHAKMEGRNRTVCF
jgi:diguanylate cyclase (GGDEF)-like protein